MAYDDNFNGGNTSESAYYGAIAQYKRDNAQKTFFTEYNDASNLIGFISSSKNEFLGNLYSNFLKYGKLSANQVEAVRKSMIKAQEYKAQQIEANQSIKFNASEGDKITLKLKALKHKYDYIQVSAYTTVAQDYFMLIDESGVLYHINTTSKKAIDAFITGTVYDSETNEYNAVLNSEFINCNFTVKKIGSFNGKPSITIKLLKPV